MSYLVYLTLFPPVILGILLVAWLAVPTRKGNILLFLSLGVPAGFGVVSLLQFLWSLIFNPSNPAFFALEFLTIIILGYLNWKQREQLRLFLPNLKRVTRLEWVTGGVFFLIAIFGLIAFINFTNANPHGRYDAWAIWNVRARMLARAGIFWKTVFVPQVFHADYPLLVPFSIAHSWLMAGTESIRIPQAIAGLFTFCTAGILAGGLREFQKRENAWVAGMFVICLPWFIYNGSRQIADIPQAACILASLISLSLFLHSTEKSHNWLVLSGLFAGISAWVKNEGQLFLLLYLFILSVAAFTLYWKNGIVSLFKYLCFGLILPLLVIGLFKTTLAPANDVVNTHILDQSLSLFLSMDRYREILRIYNLFHISFGGLQIPFLLIITIAFLFMNPRITRENKKPVFLVLGILLLQWIGYFVIYLITPHDLSDHVNQSYDRLLLHLYPSLLFVVFLMATPLSNLVNPSKTDQDTPAV